MTIPVDFDETTRLREQNRELREALSELLDIFHRLPGCPDATCTVCRQNKAALDKAKAALAQIKAALTN